MTTPAKGLLFLVATLFLAPKAEAAPPRPDYRFDGTVKVGKKVYPSASAYFSSKAFRDSGGRCGSAQEAEVVQAASPTDCSYTHTTINPEYNDERTLVIQVVFHVIKRTDAVGDITPAMLQSQIDILNEDFKALMGTPGAMGNNAKIEFVLAKFDPQGNPTTGINVVTSDAYFSDPGPGAATNDMKVALRWDTTRYLNIYTNDAAGNLGYATFPTVEAGGPEDGVVLLYQAVGRNSPIELYDQGRTATHEVGHYLGLFHTFQGGCSNTYNTADLLVDTTPEQQPQFDCIVAPSACGGGNNPIENYMDYTNDTCMTKFTAEQANRMRCSIINYRTINTKPTAAFAYSANLLAVTFTSTSMDAETVDPTQLHYLWDFGDGTTSTEQSPAHTYLNAGSYSVTLTVVDAGSGTATETQSLVVMATPPEPDADPDGGGGSGGCQTGGGQASLVLLALPFALILRRRRA